MGKGPRKTVQKAKRVIGRAAGATLGFIAGNVPGAVLGYKLGGYFADKKVERDAVENVKELQAKANANMKAMEPVRGLTKEGLPISALPKSKVSKKRYSVDTSKKASGVGIEKSGYQLPPVALPGMTKQTKQKVQQQLQNLPLRANPKAALSGVGSVVGPAILEEIAKQVPGRRTDASQFLSQYGQYAAMIPGIGPYAYLFSNLGGPLLDILIAAAEAGARNNMVAGTMGAPAGLEEYAKFLQDNPDADMTFEEYKEYMKKMDEYQKKQSGKRCQRITKAMLGGLTLEEYAEQNGIEITDEPEEGPPQYKKKDPNKYRDPTKEEREALSGNPWYAPV